MNSNVNNRIIDNTNTTTNNNYCDNKYQFLETYIDALTSSVEFYSRLNSAFIDALSVPFTDAREEIKEIKKKFKSDDKDSFNYAQQQEFYKKVEEIILSRIRDKFDINFREKSFVISLSEFIESYSKFAKATGAGLMYQKMSDVNAFWNNNFIEPIRDVMYRTPSHKIYSENKYSLFHYHCPQENELDRKNGVDDENKKIESKNFHISLANTFTTSTTGSTSSACSTPLLIIYAFINRNYIFDLLPNSSIIRNFQRQGIDVFATDWGTPSAYDKELTLDHYVNNYLAGAVDYIKEHSHSDKVSILGYCWGGDLALMLAALHPEKIKNIVTFATPGDFSIDNNLLSVWTKSLNADSIVDTFGNAPSAFINSAFLLRSPIDFLHKYPHFFFEGKPKDMDSIMQFIATEIWLYDSPPVIGEIYREFVDDCYKKNLLIKNEMTIDKNKKIDLSNIKHPFLNVIATRDDLVSPESSRTINNVIGSNDKSIIEFNSGHVGACISSSAHEELWPSVGNWLRSRCE